MSKEQVSVRIPKNYTEEIEAIQEQRGLDNRSEAARQVLRQGIDASEQPPAGEQLGRQATTVAGVGSVVAAIAAGTGAAWASALVLPFGVTTFVFALLWASIRTLGGSDLV
jgi:Arc/MetJ-type ribon-helix-helix transcriptional regulator